MVQVIEYINKKHVGYKDKETGEGARVEGERESEGDRAEDGSSGG